MPFSIIEFATGVVAEITARNLVNKLIDLSIIEVVARNRKPVGGKELQQGLENYL